MLIAPVVQKTMPIYLKALGTVTPYYSVTVKSRVDGQLMTVNVREGQSVRKGQVIARDRSGTLRGCAGPGSGPAR